MHLALLALVHAAVPLELPEGEEPSGWQAPAELAGFELGPSGEGPWARVEADGDSWSLLVEDRSGALRRVEVEVARTSAQREELAFLASSLLTPLPVVELEPATKPIPRPAPRPEPEPEPVAVVAPPVVAPEPLPVPLSLRVAAGAGAERGLGVEPVLAIGPRVQRGSLEAGLDVEISPYGRLADVQVSRHGLGGALWLGLRSPGAWSPSAAAGLGLRGQLYLSDQSVGGGLLPTAGLQLGLERGPLGLALRGEALLRPVEVLSDDGPVELGRARAVASLTWRVGDRSAVGTP